MDGPTEVLLFAAGLAISVLALYLMLKWMERRGWVNLRGGTSSVAAGANAFREFVDPPARHAHQVRDHDAKPGNPGDPP